MAEQLAAVEEFDSLAKSRSVLAAMAREADEWAGLPMPLEDQQLVIEPSYKFAAVLNRESAKPKPDDAVLVNQWWSRHYRCTVLVGRDPRDGKPFHVLDPHKPIDYQLQTLGATAAWGIAQERRALDLLDTMIPYHAFKMYLLCGMFLETSSRSKVTYLFRKLRPTVALKARGDHMRTLAALCMHPIGYYASSWAGAMCPTDDVIAHLALMRGDEHMFWKRCNQHGPHSPEAGI